MKATRLIIAAGLLFVTTVVALAQQKPGQQPAQKPPQKPSDLLSLFFHNHLDRILSPIGQPRPVPLPRARVTELREQFIDQGSKAPEPKKPMYQAAIAVCDAVSAAIDEREKAIASLQGSAAVHAPSDLGAHRKDIPNRGGIGTAMLADATLQREAHEEANRKQEARQTDNFFTVQQKNQWTQRALQLRQQIDRLYAREREAEREPDQPAAANAGPAVNTITLDKPIQLQVKYGTATIQAGTTLPVVSRDANGVVVQYMGENVVLPP
jgi:hypothetical protein